jgi:hypothetical protein
MDAYASRASKADKRITLDRLGLAYRRGRIDRAEYRLRRQLAYRAVSLAELRALVDDLADLSPGRDHWRYGRWRGPVREGRELEVQRLVGVIFLIIALVVVIVTVYGAISLVRIWM